MTMDPSDSPEKHHPRDLDLGETADAMAQLQMPWHFPVCLFPWPNHVRAERMEMIAGVAALGNLKSTRRLGRVPQNMPLGAQRFGLGVLVW